MTVWYLVVIMIKPAIIVTVLLLTACTTPQALVFEYDTRAGGYFERMEAIRGKFCNGAPLSWYSVRRYGIAGTCQGGVSFSIPVGRHHPVRR